jgi:translation initiation factor 1
VSIAAETDTLSFMRYKNTNPGGIVYSTQFGSMCPACARPVSQCVCGKDQAAPAGDGIVRVGYETKGRKGRGVTIVSGVRMTADELKNLARELKTRCGAGGTVKDWTIEIQGDHRDKVVADLQTRGFTVKRK